ncbi:hypothetical protein SO694_00008161 [Aureococcus anophagefferens]|uniref:Spondin domain-containing protein n=1 Tax=Aureococcus anophagefferens TaxID=44056 RepID=A0ABR1GE27_AURAN
MERTTILPMKKTPVRLVALAAAASAACPDLAALPSAAARGLDPAALAGTFYEQAFYDFAQVGATCQKMTNVVTDDGAIAQSFDVRYGPLPFALPLVYEPTDEPAVFTRPRSTSDRPSAGRFVTSAEKALLAAGLNRTLAPVDHSTCDDDALRTGDGKCCDTCDASQGLVKYYSTDGVHDHCGETCIKPAEFWLYKIFEKNLTLAPYEHICKDLISNNGSHHCPSTRTVDYWAPFARTRD